MSPRVAGWWLALVVALAACSGSDDGSGDDADPAPTTAATNPTTTTTPTGPAATTAPSGSDPVPVLDWDALPEPPVEVEGWDVGHCEGGAPLLCVGRPGGRPGTVETLTFPGAGDLDAFTETFLANARADRLAGCPPGTTVVDDPVLEVTVGGQPGRRVGFTVVAADGTVVEHGVSWARTEPDGLRTVGATGLDPARGCLEPIGEFTVPDFEAVLDLLGRLVARSEF